MIKPWLTLLTFWSLNLSTILAQIKPLASTDILLGLHKLNTLGSVLYFAAHPDDENTKLIAWLAQEKKYRTGYLSLTRGDGGQNLIGTEQGIDLGLIRTQELLAARALDKSDQFFTSAYDFGFSKTHEETFSFWDKETALREAVWIIRKFRPDIIINRFPPDKRGGHGHHQASAILAEEAFNAAANPKMFSEQLTEVEPWQAKRLFWNTANFGGQNNTAEDQLKIDIGSYNPLLGKSYGEISAHSRSQHKSQGFGSASSRGQSIEYFVLIEGEAAYSDLFEGIETTWGRIPNSEKIKKTISRLIKQYQPSHPERSISDLIQLRSLISKIDDNFWKKHKTDEIDKLIFACAGLSVEAYSAHAQYPINKLFEVKIDAIVQNPSVNIELVKINNSIINKKLTKNITVQQKESMSWPSITQPYWLNEPHTLGKFGVKQADLGYPTNPKKPSANLIFKIENQELLLSADIKYKSVDPVLGERHQDISISPSLTMTLDSKNSISINDQPQNIRVKFSRMDKDLNKVSIRPSTGKEWSITPNIIEVDFENNESVIKEITIKPLYKNVKKEKLTFYWDNQLLHEVKTITYDHIPVITWYPIAETMIQNIEITNPIKRVAYIAGAGDLIPQSIAQIGIETTILTQEQISPDILNKYDAVIIGVRFLNINSETDKTNQAILDYVKQGGTALYQYNVNTKIDTNTIGPYSFSIGRNRVTEEDAIVEFDKNDPSLNFPNKITELDFENWRQERGLYFAENIDKRYRTPLKMNDKNEPKNNGALLVANYGKGKFVYTSLSFFRQLPAGVPGAYRLFVNLLSKEK